MIGSAVRRGWRRVGQAVPTARKDAGRLSAAHSCRVARATRTTYYRACDGKNSSYII
jgi:hypothetical protein